MPSPIRPLSPRSVPGFSWAADPRTALLQFWRRGLPLLAAFLLLLGVLSGPEPARASLDNDRYDGNIFALYAGNGSLVPPRLTLADALAEKRVTVVVYYLDDSATSKQFAGVVSELQRVWGGAIELLPLVTDPLQGRADEGPTDPLHYWRGSVPEVVVLGADGQVVFQGAGAVDLGALNGALSRATGLPLPPALAPDAGVSFNELTPGLPAAPSASAPHG
jgi:hypothetical protein